MAAITLGLLSSGLNYYGGLRAKSAQRKARERQEANFQRQLGMLNLYGDLGESELRSGLNTLSGGYERARADVGAIGQAAYQRASDQAQVARGQAQQNLLSTGFDRSNIANQVDRSLAADTLRRRQEIDSSLAGLYSQLSVNKARSEADMRRALAAQMSQRGNALAGAYGNFGQTMLGLDTTSFQSPQIDLSPFYGLFAKGKDEDEDDEGEGEE